jgi:NTP pyrophosphatase (non-canonical NTP hydrolase)
VNLTDLAHQCFEDNKKWFPDKATDLRHHALGLAGEAGEVANWVKKVDRGTHSLDDPGVRKEIGEEAVDVMIYALSVMAILGVDPVALWDLKRAKNKRRFTKEDEA